MQSRNLKRLQEIEMSNSIYDIMGFYFDLRTFTLGARTAISRAQQNTVDNATSRQRTIARHCAAAEEKQPNQSTLDAAYRKFKSHYTRLNVMEYSSREVRALIYCLHKFENDTMVSAFTKVLDKQWRNRFLNGLLYFLLSYWDITEKSRLQVIIDVFQRKLSAYNGKRDKYLLLKQNARFLTLNGAELLGMTLRKMDVGQTNCCSIFSASSVFFGLSSNNIEFQYYSKVISSYFGRDAIEKLDMLKDVLDKHNYDATPKRIIPAMIIQNRDAVNEGKQDYIRSIALGMIGNPELSSKWSLRNGTAEENLNLKEARQILNEWLKRKFISIFFEKCMHEPSRQKYWLKHIEMIGDLEIWTTPFTMSLLMQDKRIADMFNTKVKVLNNEKNVDKSALIMTVGNYFFIEFSDVGCLYIFQKNSPYGLTIASNRFLYFDEIKRMRVDTIQSFYLKNQEGKINHNTGWENTLEKWMKCHSVIQNIW